MDRLPGYVWMDWMDRLPGYGWVGWIDVLGNGQLAGLVKKQ